MRAVPIAEPADIDLTAANARFRRSRHPPRIPDASKNPLTAYDFGQAARFLASAAAPAAPTKGGNQPCAVVLMAT